MAVDWPFPHWRQSGRGQPELERGYRGLREASSTKLQTGSVANQEFLGFWMVDIRLEGHARDQLPRRDTQHT